MVQDFKPYDVRPRTDLNVVPQFGWLNLRISYATGVVQGNIESVEGNFNGIDDPRGILGKPDDVFAALRASASVESVAAPSSASHPSAATEMNNEGA